MRRQFVSETDCASHSCSKRGGRELEGRKRAQRNCRPAAPRALVRITSPLKLTFQKCFMVSIWTRSPKPVLVSSENALTSDGLLLIGQYFPSCPAVRAVTTALISSRLFSSRYIIVVEDVVFRAVYCVVSRVQ